MAFTTCTKMCIRDRILADHGYQSEAAGDDYINTGVNWGYTGAQLSDSMDPLTTVSYTHLAIWTPPIRR